MPTRQLLPSARHALRCDRRFACILSTLIAAQGFAQQNQGQTSCGSCGPGYFASEAGQQQCEKCSAGRYSTSFGSDDCLTCWPGTWQPNQGATTCQPAEIGYSALNAIRAKCPARTIAPVSGLSVCQSCDSNAVASDDSVQCLCQKGFYLDDYTLQPSQSTADAPCVPCQTGLDCGNKGTRRSSLSVLPGYWRYPNNATVSIYACPLYEYCVGGIALGGQCFANRDGPLCAL